VNRDQYLSGGMALLFAKRGNELPHARLNEDSVRAIRRNESGLIAKQMARQYQVHYRSIEKIRYYETWRHVA